MNDDYQEVPQAPITGGTPEEKAVLAEIYRDALVEYMGKLKTYQMAFEQSTYNYNVAEQNLKSAEITARNDERSVIRVNTLMDKVIALAAKEGIELHDPRAE